MKSFNFALFCFLFNQIIIAQPKQITLEDIWSKGTFRSKSVPGFNFMKDGKHYTSIEENSIVRYDITTGKVNEVILKGADLKDKQGFSGSIEGYSFNHDESKIILEENAESIYRHSYKSKVYVYDRATKVLHKVFDMGSVANPSISSDGQKVAFTYDNNLYYKDLTTNKTIQITNDGKRNQIINGMCDWVYEEEFSFTKAYEWSPDGQKIAFIRFDESKVPEYYMPMYEDGTYPRNEVFKYPKVGEKNSDVKVIIYDVQKNKSFEASIGDLNDMYIPRIKWTNDPNTLCIFKLNRLQNHLQLHLIDTKTKKTRILLEEKNKYYIEIHDNLTFLKDGAHFIWTSEKNGFNSLYLYNMKGQEIEQITPSKFDVLSMYGIDERKSTIYFKAAEKSPMEHQVFSIKTTGKDMKIITPLPGVNDAQFSPTFEYFSWSNSTINSPTTYNLYKTNGEKVRTLQDNAALKNIMVDYNVSPIEFFQFTTSEKVVLNGWILKPANFDPNKKYPLFMTQYSGPGSQEVINSFRGSNYWWYQMLSQMGYYVACVDPRGTGARGEEFKKMTYLQLGKYETIDQIEAAKYLGSLPNIDKDRIGIFGWSYGGYMSSLCILKGNDVFKAAIAVAPVTNWKWYDSIYTERYMRTLKENADGYKENSPVYFADRLKGNYLLIHGMGDDNVHFQNAAEMAKQLIENNKQFDTYYYPNKNHGIYGGKTRLHLYTKMTNFIKEKL